MQLQYLLAVQQSGHFGRAAKSLAISQPTLSAQIRKAENELGILVFDRQSKPITATPAGARVLDKARDIVHAHEELVEIGTETSAQLRGPFALGVIPTLAPYVLPWFLAAFAEAYPAIELSIFERTTDELLAAMASKQVDAAILATPLREASIEERVLFYDPFYLYTQAEESIAARDELSVEELDPSKIWLLEDGHCVREQVTSFCRVRERLHLGSVRFAGGSFETLRNLIDASEGYTLVPETYARTLPASVRQRSIRSFAGRTPTREISLVHHRRSAKRLLSDAVHELIGSRIPRSLRQVASDGEVLSLR